MNKGWAYLLHFDNHPPARSSITYATFDRKANQVRAQYYSIDYAPGRDFFTGMRFAHAAGGSGENILDRLKIRMSPTFSLFLTDWSPVFTEEDFAAEVEGVKNGPVRAIRRVQHGLDLGAFFPKGPTATVYTYYYYSSFVTPSKLSFPWLVVKAMRNLRFTGVSDFRRAAVGMTYWDAANPEGLQLTGRNQTRLRTSRDHDWWVLSGAGGMCLHVFIVPEELLEVGIVRGTVFLDDDTFIDEEGPEAEPGTHALGYRLLNVDKLRQSGDYDATLAMIVLPDRYKPGDEQQPLAMLKQPLLADVHPVER